jgi:hypothetical protein
MSLGSNLIGKRLNDAITKTKVEEKETLKLADIPEKEKIVEKVVEKTIVK